MSNPSPASHLYRLGFLLAAGVVAFVVIATLATPSSWNYEVWYRGDAPAEMAQQPLVYGGIAAIGTSTRNESCQTCHVEDVTVLSKQKHKTLSCESCHGALADHAQAEDKVADAWTDRTRSQCLNCHAPLISRPRRFPQFTSDIAKHKAIEPADTCLKCHDAHDPTP